MLWLKRLTATKKNLVGPDFEQAPWYELDLSGTKVKFRNPPQTALFPTPVFPAKWNIYNNNLFTHWADSKGMTAEIFKNGWHYYGNFFSTGEYGGLVVDITLQRRSLQNKETDTLFKKSDLVYWILNETERDWGKDNKQKWENRESYTEKIDPDKHFWQYPKSEIDIHTQAYNGSEWTLHEVYKPDKKRDRIWSLPISDDHLLGISFLPSAIRCDYFDPTHNLDEAVENTIQTFMSNLFITLSPDAEQRYKTIKAEEQVQTKAC